MKTSNTLNARRLDRRHFLGGAALGAAGLGLAACNGDDDEASAQETPIPAVPQPSGSVAQARDAVLPPFADQRTIGLTL